MRTLLELATNLLVVAGGIIASSLNAYADQTRAVGVVAINYSGTNITSLSSAIAVGKNSAAGTASINGSETAASAIGGAGVLTVTNPNSTNVIYQMDGESAISLGITPIATPVSLQIGIDNTDGINKAVTVFIP